jgi:hypothetical protein
MVTNLLRRGGSARLALLAALPMALVGCRAGYDVDIRNLTDQPITAKLSVPHTDGAPQTLQERFIGVGNREHLFVQRDAGERVSLVVDFRGNVGYPATLDLSRGATVVNVRRSDEGATGRLTLEALPRP